MTLMWILVSHCSCSGSGDRCATGTVSAQQLSPCEEGGKGLNHINSTLNLPSPGTVQKESAALPKGSRWHLEVGRKTAKNLEGRVKRPWWEWSNTSLHFKMPHATEGNHPLSWSVHLTESALTEAFGEFSNISFFKKENRRRSAE